MTHPTQTQPPLTEWDNKAYMTAIANLTAERDQLRAQVERLQCLPAAPALVAWQPIETCPKDTVVILYGAKRSEMVIGMYHTRDGWVIDTPSEWVSMYPPKYWQPLPPPPVGTDGGEG